MDDKKRRTVSREVHPTGSGKKPPRRPPAPEGSRPASVRTPEQPRTSARTAQRRRERAEERTAMKIKERKVSPTPVRHKRTPARPEAYAQQEKPRPTAEPGVTLRKTDPRRRKDGYGKKRRRNRVLLVSAGLVLVAAVVLGIVFGIRVLFKVDTVTVSGETRYDTEDILAAAGITQEDNLLFLPAGKAADAVDELFPWIGRVEVRRHFPDTVEIHVEEAVPSCVFSYGEKYLLVSDAGRILEVQESLPTGYFCVYGLELVSYRPGDTVEIQDETAARAYEEIAAVLTEEGITKVQSADLSDVYDISLLYDGRITMKLGSPTDLRYKIRFGMKIVSGEGGDGLSATDRGVLDLSLTRDSNKAYFSAESAVSGVSSEPESGTGSQPGEGETSSGVESGENGSSSAAESGGEVSGGENTSAQP